MRRLLQVCSSVRTTLAPTVSSAILALLATLVLVVGCDTSVQTLRSNDQYHYSVFGVLDPAQDTQWVRIESLRRPTSGGASASLDVTVTLENLSTNQSWTLRDSLMLVEGEQQHNFWTTAPILASTSYELTVQDSAGEVTRASTTIPDRPPAIRLEDPIRLPCSPIREANEFVAVLMDVEEVAGVRMTYFQSVFGPPVTYEFDHYDDVTERKDTAYAATINYSDDLPRAQRTMERRCLADSAEIMVAAGGPDWPEWARYNDASIVDIARPDSFSNVTGGHGLLSGIYSTRKKVPITERSGQ